METIIARLQTPADDDGVRKDVHFITSGDAVIVEDNGNLATLNERLDQIGGGITISGEQPERACVWYQVKYTEVRE